jgi:L-threonylcarbamoyladenylate synthase
VAPSANLSGRPSPTTWQAVLEDLDGRIDCILKGDPTEIGLESTVVDCTGEVAVILRQGAISLDEIRSVFPSARSHAGGVETARSPGMKHRHYSPSARVVFWNGGDSIDGAGDVAAFIGIEKPNVEFAVSKVCGSVEEYARELFEFFRECDRRGIATVYCQEVPEVGIGSALMDRLRRAASGK